MRSPILTGRLVSLHPLQKRHVELVISWITDPEVNAFMISGHDPITPEDEARWYDTMTASDSDLVVQIHVLDGDRYIGNTGLHDIDHKNRNAELGIMIGDKTQWGRGYGRDAIVTLLRHAFDTLGLHRVHLRCHPENTRGLSAYEAVGFTRVGHEREAVLVDGRFQDHIVFDMLEGEFRARYGVAE